VLLELSQVVFGVSDLEAAARRIRALGLEVLEGGVHPGLGTANRIVPLGRQYLELLGVVDHEQAATNDYGRALLVAIADGDRLVRWSLRTDAIEAVARLLALPVERRQRLRPDGVRLTWRAAGLALSLQDGWLPFFMQWDDPTQYPGAPEVAHPCGAHEVSRLEVCAADPSRLDRWVGAADAPLLRVGGAPGLRRVVLADQRGRAVVELP
jgi:Glyoxalase-like domain